MKLKILATVSLGAFLLLAGCRGDDNKNTVLNTNTNTNTATVMTPTPTPIVQTNESKATDTVLKDQIEKALKGKGFNNVTVDTSTTPATLRGSVPKGRMAEAVRTAQEAAGKPLTNQITEQ
jgi:osmotically-inducible protein OsmY